MAPEPNVWLSNEFAAAFALALEAMTGEKPGASAHPLSPAASGTDPDCLWWRQPLRLAPDCTIWLGASTSAWTAIGQAVLSSAGVEENTPESIRDTYIETAGQAFGSVARALSNLLRQDVACEPRDAQPPEAALPLFRIELVLSGPAPVSLLLAISPALLTQVSGAGDGSASPAPPALGSASEPPALANHRQLDLLLDVQLPVSVSFGQSQLPLKDVIKLTTGSIVELNRTVSEPVEVIVNNCVIARGEVVVVEGNFGVRIQQVVSRQERLRSIQ